MNSIDAAIPATNPDAGTDAVVRRRAMMWQILVAGLIGVSALFNALLAIVNGHVFGLGSGAVALIQAGIVLAALALGSFSQRPPARWLFLAWALVMLFCMLSLARDGIMLKNLGDVLLIPAFICLGTRIQARPLIVLILLLQLVITAIGVWELASPGTFAETFKVIDYYVKTRGFAESSFWADNDLFLSSQRPTGRLLLAGSGLHRGSSVFLEPVSLGNWVVVVTIFVAAFWRRLRRIERVGLIVGNIVLLVVCDGRLAIGVCIALIVYLPIARWVPSRLSALYIPAVFLALAAVIAAGYLEAVGDTFPGRLRGGMDSLFNLDVAQLFGVGSQNALSADAGWAYFIQSQSIFAAIAVWLTITLTDIGEDGPGRVFKHGLAVFIALCLPVSYSILSIKTTGVLWAAYGFFYARRRAGSPVPTGPTSSRSVGRVRGATRFARRHHSYRPATTARR